MKKIQLSQLKKLIRQYPIILFVAAALLLCIVFVPYFVSGHNLRNLCLQICDLLVVACGLTFVQLNASIDFSCTSVLGVSSVIGAYIMSKSPLAGSPAVAIPVAVIVMIAIGALFGVINGFAVVKLKMPAFIATMSTMLIGSAFAVWFTAQFNALAASIGGLPKAFFVLGGSGGAFAVPIVLSIGLFLFADWLLRKTRFGRQVYAIGTNPKAAFISGMPVKKTIFLLFLLCGVFAGIQGVILTARNQAGMSGLGSTMFINIVAAVIIGGTSVTGGFGGVRQTLLGVIFIAFMNNGMNLIGVEWYVMTLIQGILIFVATLIDYFIKNARVKTPHEARARKEAT